MNKRQFLQISGGSSLSILIGDRLWAEYSAMPAERIARREDFWSILRAKYRLKPDYINLENGYYSMQSQPVLEQFINKVRDVNYQASYYMRTTQFPDKAAAAARLAAMGGCSPDEVIITRNA